MISLCAVGDLMLGDSEKCIGYGTRSLIEKFGTDYPFEAVADKLKADIVFGNLESVMSDYGYDQLDMFSAQMRASSGTIDGLKKIFNVINVANNHIMQHGEYCFNETIESLLRSNIGVVGLKGSGSFSSQPYIERVSGLDVGFLGYAFEKDAYCDKPLYAQGEEQAIFGDISQLKLKVDIVIVSCHWGDEFIQRPSLKIIKLAKKIIDNGASVILGHHPHVVQPVEIYNKGIIAFSLGNFISDMAWDATLLTGLLVTIHIDGMQVRLNRAVLFKNSNPSQPDIFKNITFNGEEIVTLKRKHFSFYEKEYASELKKMINANRRKTYLYFFKNYLRMKNKIFFQILHRRLIHF